jgi:hypothetical protein
MPRGRDEASGKYTERYPLPVFVDALRNAEEGLAGTGEIAERVGCSKRLALLKLDELVDEGRVRCRNIGRSKVWLPVNEEPESVTEEATAELGGTIADHPSTERPLYQYVAVREMYEHLREQRTATQAEFFELVDGESVPDDTSEEFVMDCLDTLGNLPSVEAPGKENGDWRFIDGHDSIDQLMDEPSADTLLDALDEGRRISVQTEFLGKTYSMTLRMENGVYYCDTPVMLHRHENRQEMRACIEKYGYVDAQIEAIE